MESFRSGESSVLVATSIVEVGLDVPELSVLWIENADLFGLSQLHQLRGRVGRGDRASWCFFWSRRACRRSGPQALPAGRPVGRVRSGKDKAC